MPQFIYGKMVEWRQQLIKDGPQGAYVGGSGMLYKCWVGVAFILQLCENCKKKWSVAMHLVRDWGDFPTKVPERVAFMPVY